MKDILGNNYVKGGMILTDPTFEKRLKSFDPRLELVFDQFKKKWVILEYWASNQLPNIVMTCEDRDGVAMPPGQWVFQKLYVMRHNYEATRDDIDKRWNDLQNQQNEQIEIIDKDISNNFQALIRDERNLFRKINRHIKNEPISDVTAGYPKA